MKIIYTNHASKKFKDLEELGVYITRKLVNNIINNPFDIDEISDYPNKIATGKFNKNHVLRVVYRKESDIIIVITFYPARKERYL